MIKYSLKCVEKNCKKNEPFDGWFQNSTSFDKQIKAGYISCPYCGSLNIKKNLMSPSVKSTKEKIPKMISKNVKHNELNKNSNKQIDMMVILRNLKKEIQKNAEFVGKNFTKEAKAIHESKMIIKKKRLSKELDDNEVYWLCISLWGARLCGMEL